jgi:hypothetical protein
VKFPYVAAMRKALIKAKEIEAAETSEENDDE